MVSWTIKFSPAADKEFSKLDRVVQKRIRKYFEERVLPQPYRLAEALTGNKKGLWRYRIGDYRVVTNLEDQVLMIMIIRVGHRKDVYDF
ncbi:MAG: type II toxin-antitoxin system RelE/ParE family toxin [Alphaproteobacteria bacterium]|nr:type II toxin-antitoxin system RelE/ParE family toxin [Alphaproteobacteria bacterium]